MSFGPLIDRARLNFRQGTKSDAMVQVLANALEEAQMEIDRLRKELQRCRK